MNCRDARNDIALYAGGDLDDASRLQELRRHVAECSGCRERYQSARGALKVLRGAAAGVEAASGTWDSSGSLWPSIQREMSRPPQPASVRALRQLRHWTPFAAMTVACGLMVAAVTYRAAPRDPQAASPRGLQVGPPLTVRPESESRRSESEGERPPAPLAPALRPDL